MGALSVLAALVVGFALLAPLAAGLPATGPPATTALAADAQFLDWTLAGTGSPCTPGSHLIYVAHFYGTAKGGVPPYRSSWNFGDGTNSTDLENPTHEYGSAYEPWTVRLSVVDSVDSVNTSSLRVFVAPVNGPAEPHPVLPTEPTLGTIGWVAWGIAGIVIGGATGLYFVARERDRVGGES